jgi:hypothetical protein
MSLYALYRRLFGYKQPYVWPSKDYTTKLVIPAVSKVWKRSLIKYNFKEQRPNAWGTIPGQMVVRLRRGKREGEWRTVGKPPFPSSSLGKRRRGLPSDTGTTSGVVSEGAAEKVSKSGEGAVGGSEMAAGMELDSDSDDDWGEATTSSVGGSDPELMSMASPMVGSNDDGEETMDLDGLDDLDDDEWE